ncbi:DotU family type IV/VI secretion system protein, partial [Pseudomonas syringae group genomosp. 7]|uniref:DotU family type IV/VI secretion system protein n=1 Tax=Pseudomonas syringae group genomosp. 7 TaxID=251699 RepID=UPI00376FDAFF
TMALILRRVRQAISVSVFEAIVETFFAYLERQARSANYSVEQVKDAMYALCAILDESVHRSGDNDMRRQFEMAPLQF